MPKTLGGLVGWTVMAVAIVVVGLWIVNRVKPISNFVYGKAA
jgi:hypothetical protein